MRALLLFCLAFLPALAAQETPSVDSAEEARALSDDVRELKVYTADDAALKALAKLKKIEKLSVSARNSALSQPGYEAVGSLTTLKELAMIDCGSLDDEALRALSYLAGLTSLQLDEPGKITAAGLRYLREMKGLKRLEILHCTSIDDACLKNIGALLSLEVLMLENCGACTDAGLGYLGDLALKRLTFSDQWEIDGSGLARLKIEGLEFLDLSGTTIEDEGIKALGRGKALTSLAFGAVPTGAAAFKELAKCKALRCLTLVMVDQPPEVFDVLGELAALETLDIGYCPMANTCTRSFSKLANLRELNLAATTIGDAALEPIGKLAKLEVVNLDKCSISAAGLKHLAGCPALRELSVANTGADDAACVEIAKLKKLEKIELRGTPITISGVDALSRLASLKELDLAECEKVSDACLVLLAGVKTLTYLNLRGCKMLTPEKIAELAKALPLCLIVK